MKLKNYFHVLLAIFLLIPVSIVFADYIPDFPHFMYRMEVEDFSEDFLTLGKTYYSLPILDPYAAGLSDSYLLKKYETNDSVHIMADGLAGGGMNSYETLINAIEAYFGADVSQSVRENFPREDFGIDDDKKTFDEKDGYIFWYLAGNNHRGYAITITREPIFTDLIDWEYQWEADSVIWLFGEGIISGIGNKLFAPNNNITRAQFAVLFARTMGISGSEYNGSFPDVPDGLYYTGIVEMMVKMGYIKGYADGYFHPDNTISYQDVFLLAYRYLEDNDLLSEGTWDTVNISDHIELDEYVKQAIDELYDLNLIRYPYLEVVREPGTRIRIAEFLCGVREYMKYRT